MSATNVMIELEPSLLAKLDRFVEGRVFHSRSEAVAAAVQEKIERLESHDLFLAECQKLDPAEEQAFAEENKFESIMSLLGSGADLGVTV